MKKSATMIRGIFSKVSVILTSVLSCESKIRVKDLVRDSSACRFLRKQEAGLRMTVLVSVLGILSMPFSGAVAFAQMPVGVPIAAMVPAGLERVGVVAAAGGQVELTTPGQVGRIAQSGQPIFLGDLVSTDAQGHLQILLLDETVFTIGPNSAITIDKFVYDPKSSVGEIKASITKGVFRYVSGKIAVKNPKNVTVKLPTSTLGFRGTIVGGAVQPSGQGLVGLLGPGGNNDGGARNGSFTIEGEGGDQQGVDRTGFGVEVGADGGVSDVFQMSDDQINGLTNGLGGGQGGGGGGGNGGNGGNGGEGGGLGGDNMDDLSGETGAMTGDDAGFTQGLNGLGTDLNNLSDATAQYAADQKAFENETPTVAGEATTYGQLQAASDSVSGSYFGSGAFGGNANGLNAYFEIVFGNTAELSKIGGGSSYVLVTDNNSPTPRSDSFLIAESNEGPAFFNGVDANQPAVFNWTGTGDLGGEFKVTVTLTNSTDQVAQKASVTVDYTKGANFPSIAPNTENNATAAGPLILTEAYVSEGY